MPSKTRKQANFFLSELIKKGRGQATETGLPTDKLKEFAFSMVKNGREVAVKRKKKKKRSNRRRPS